MPMNINELIVSVLFNSVLQKTTFYEDVRIQQRGVLAKARPEEALVSLDF